MPLFDYLCDECGRTSEVLQRFDEPPLAACPHCGGTVKKQLSAPAFHLKGSGWYATDYAKKSGGETAKAGGAAKDGASSGAGQSPGAPDAATPAKSEGKPESKADASAEAKS